MRLRIDGGLSIAGRQDAPFGLGDDLAGDDHDVAVGDAVLPGWPGHVGQLVRDDRGEVVAR
jgi:hypothetical protein